MINKTKKSYWLQQQAEINPNKIAIQEQEKKLTFLELFNTVIKAISYLKSNQIKEKENVAILSNNSIEFIIIVNALWLLGAVPVPINIRLKHSEISKLIKHSKSTAVVNINTNMDLEEIECKRKITFSSFEFLGLNQITATDDFIENSTALLMYSSGSTGMPKCVELTFDNLYTAASSFKDYTNCLSQDVWLASLPFYHIGGFSIITRSLINGNKIVIPKSFSVKDLSACFKETKPSYFSVVPTVMQRILDSKIKSWQTLKAVFIGGGPVPEEIISLGIKNNWPIVKVYGSTETSAMVTAIDLIGLKEKPLSAGRPLKNVTIEIVDESKRKLQNGKVGEIVVESDSIAKQYFNNNGNSKIKNGKFYTNDLGYLDEDGFLFIEGRKDDIIISGGENVSLIEIEEIVKKIDVVNDCTTLKIKDKTWGESYFLIISVSKNEKRIKEIISKKLKETFAKYKHPKDIYILNKIPRNELGKVMKEKIKKLLP